MLLAVAAIVLLYVLLGHLRGCLITLLVLWVIGYLLGGAHGETVMTPMDDRGQAVVERPWEWLTPDERLEQLRQLSTARCLPYQRLERRSTGLVCVERR